MIYYRHYHFSDNAVQNDRLIGEEKLTRK